MVRFSIARSFLVSHKPRQLCLSSVRRKPHKAREEAESAGLFATMDASPGPPKPARHSPTAGTGSTRAELESQLLLSLECPVCMEYMTPPIPMCEIGHSVCRECCERCRNCPTCRRPLLRTRNLALEALARGLSYPCRHVDEGCALRLPADDLLQHSRLCPYRPLGCPLNWGRRERACEWRGPQAAMRAHLEAHHPRRFSVFSDADASAVMWEISQAGCFRDYTHVVFAFGEAFVYHKRFDMRERKLFFAVARAGGVRPAPPAFRYKYKMCRAGGRQSLSFSCAVHATDEDVHALVMAGAAVSIDFETLVVFGKDAQRFFSIRRERHGHASRKSDASRKSEVGGVPDTPALPPSPPPTAPERRSDAAPRHAARPRQEATAVKPR